MICSKCGAKLDEGDSFCTMCGGKGIEPSNTPENETAIENKTEIEPITNTANRNLNKANIKSATLMQIGCALCAVFLLIGIYFCYKGFDYKNNYYSSEDYSSLNVNAYVGGDAYNYIINGTYFTGYLAFGGAAIICGMACLCSSGVIYVMSEKRERD